MVPAGEDRIAAPEFVIVPARPDVRPDHRDEVIFEVRRMTDGQLVLPAFSSIERLLAVLGRNQPWVAVPLEKLRALMGSSGVSQVTLDPAAEPGTWRWQEHDIETLAQAGGPQR